MYEFVDTNQAGSKSSLPSEALQIDGTYIENLIDGYRTLYVTGRELLGSEISEREIDLVDGSEYTGKRDTTRSITVGYQLLCTSPREFQEKFNKLSGILNKEQAKLIFADEPDKYFIGTKSSVGDVEPGRLNVKGEFTFYCCDPRKYSAAEKKIVYCPSGKRISDAYYCKWGHRIRSGKLRYHSQPRKWIYRDCQ